MSEHHLEGLRGLSDHPPKVLGTIAALVFVTVVAILATIGAALLIAG
jgi:hypothetical protein